MNAVHDVDARSTEKISGSTSTSGILIRLTEIHAPIVAPRDVPTLDAPLTNPEFPRPEPRDALVRSCSYGTAIPIVRSRSRIRATFR